MKRTLLISAAAFALLVTPALAQQQKSQTSGQGQSQQLPRLFTGPGVIQGNNVYDCTGKYLGADPDAAVRHQMLREGDPSCWGH